ncbi:MAG: PD40 domain-containing protein [Actinobacteria bacterium]|nr:PD40 domain-containing protein [Actinomycetota bacterium]
MSRKVALTVLVGFGLLAAACKPSSEIRPPFIKESELPSDSLFGEIVFTGQSARVEALFELQADSGEAVRISARGTEERSPVFSPDGSRLAFASTSDDGVSGIYVRSAAGGGRTAVVEGTGFFDYPTWSPDGSRIAYAHTTGTTGNWDIFVVGLDGKGRTQLTTSPGHEWSPAWSPDGSRIAFTSDRDGTTDVWLLDPATGAEEKIVAGDTHDEQPAWSPDGSRIAFTSDRELERWQVFIYDVATGQVSQLIRTDSQDRYPTWSPDGRHILVSVGYLAVYNADGSRFPNGADRWKLSDELGLSSTWAS